MATYPRYGKPSPADRLRSNNQVQESETRDQEDRFKWWDLREVGAPKKRSVRATPDQFFVEGARFVGTDRSRQDGFRLDTDTGDE